MLHNSSSEDEDLISSIVGEDRHLEEDFALEFNQRDFDLRDEREKFPPMVALSAKSVQQVLDHQHWPPSTYSASSGIFVVTPKDHTAQDPRFKPSKRKSRVELNDDAFPRPRGTFEPCFTGEPSNFIQYRMDAFTTAWDMCLQRCTKVVSAHFKLAVTELCRFLRQTHNCWSWPINIIPTAVVVLGVDTSDYPIFFGVLKRHLKHGQRRVAFLDPAVCNSVSRLMDSFFKQVAPNESKSSGFSMATLQRYVEEVRETSANPAAGFSGFSLTVVIQTAEHWANTDVLSEFLEMVSHYAAFLELTVVLQLSAGRDQLSAALPAATLQLMSSKTFHVTSSSSAIDLVLKHTLFAKDAPFKTSHKFLKWTLENLKFLNHSISALVTKLKLVYWRFFYTQPLSWLLGEDGLKLLVSVAFSPGRNALVAPFERLIESFFAYHRMSEEEMVNHKFIQILHDMNEIPKPSTPPAAKANSRTRRQKQEVAANQPEANPAPVIRATLNKWLSSFRRSMALKATALELFVSLKHFSISSESSSAGSLPGVSNLEEELKKVQSIRDVAEMGLGHRKIAKDFTIGLAADEDLEIHDWYGCPYAYEYYALITSTRQVVHAALGYVRRDENKLRNVLRHWMTIIEGLEDSRDTKALFEVLQSIFEPYMEWLEEAGEDMVTEEENESALDHRATVNSRRDKILDNLLKKMEEVLISAFEEQETAKTPLSESFATSDEDVALLNRRFNPNIKPSQENGLSSLIADIERVKITAPRKRTRPPR